MKKFLLVLFVLGAVALYGCEEASECIDLTECPTCEVCETCEETPQLAFYEQMYFEGSGYTPAYDYFLSGTLNEDGEIEYIRYNMVASNGVSKRSSQYLMNNATVLIGGSAGNQTIEIFIGGSTENIAQVFNYIRGTIAQDGSTLLFDLGISGAYPGAPVNHQDEIYALLGNALDVTIDETTMIKDLLEPIGFYSSSTDLVKNGMTSIELTGAYGGGSFHNQLKALEAYIVDNALTLEEVYELVSSNNQGYDNRDVVAGATILFDPKIVEITAKAAGITIDEQEPMIIGHDEDETSITITVKTFGYNEMIVQVTFDLDHVITAVDVLSHTETQGYGLEVIEGDFLDQFLGHASEDVDVVSGVTLTSQGIIDAIKLAEEAIAE
jgi:hypothetical protein